MKRIAYILDMFPVTSETFIVREIMEMQKQGLEIALFPLKDTTGTVHSRVVHEDSKTLLQSVHQFSSLKRINLKSQLFCLHLKYLLRYPLRYARTFRLAWRSRGKNYGYFKRAPIYSAAFERMGISQIHAHFSLDGCKMAMLCSLLSGIPYSFTIHAHDIFIGELHDLFEEKFKFAKFVASISEFNKQFVLNRYPSIDPTNIHIVHCGINMADFERIERQDNKVLNILSVGRLVEQKGLIFLINACGILEKQTAFKYKCRIIGEGKDRARLETAIADQGLAGSVKLLGAREQSEVIRYMNEADVFVLPCIAESNGAMDGIPVALMEAMAKGIPIVSTTLSGIPELVFNGAGKLTQPEDPIGLAEALFEISRFSLAQKEQMGVQARRIVSERFNIEIEAEKLKKLFRS